MTDFTTIANVLQWLALPTGTPDTALLTRLISACSAAMQTYLNRDIISTNYVDTFDGNGKSGIALRNFPVTAVSSVLVNNISISPASNPVSTGFLFDTYSVNLKGYCFEKGVDNVEISYTAGYSTVPLDIEQACIDWIAYKYQSRNWIGQKSKSLKEGGTSTYQTDGLPDFVKLILDQYKKVAPV